MQTFTRNRDVVIDRSNLAERVYINIREALISGQYLPGDRLRIGELAKIYGTSNTPVREALLRLVSEHALEMQTASKIIVPNLSLSRYQEIKKIRCELEGLAVECATKFITKEDIETLKIINEKFTLAEEEEKAVDMFYYNQRFHFYIYERCNQPILLAMITNMAAAMGPILRSFYSTNQKGYRSGCIQHKKMITAFENENPTAARTALLQDISMIAPLIEQFLGGEQGVL
ncbi:GntR family transcriptional regulator [Vibrio sp. Vb339]|uniref:GntR family transcriptional regulator n=1 Tax=Vibrio sp. Vb339 TaxID=1192013 RepID=UPI001551ED9E|nr:GntR family transcriptional regulator [Vibrio sp. Vb339]